MSGSLSTRRRETWSSQDTERAEARFLWPPIVIAVILLWIAPLGTSLGGDEAGNWWMIKDGIREALARCFDPQFPPGSQSLIYNLVAASTLALGGDHEFVLRLPSVAAMLGALFLLYRLGVKFVGPLAAMIACLVFICLKDVVYVASTVRPYALGMLFVVGAMLALVNWFDTGRLRYGAVYALLAALTVYAHVIMAMMFLIHAGYAAGRLRAPGSRLRLRQVLIAWAASAAMLSPLLSQLARLFANRAQHVYRPSPSPADLAVALAPPLIVGAVVLALLLALVMARQVAFEWLPPAGVGWFLASWALGLPAILFLISSITATRIFIDRYYLASMPAMALLAGSAIRAIQPEAVRRLAASVILIFAIAEFSAAERFARGTEGWRETAQAVRTYVGTRPVPVLLVSSFVEAEDPEAVQGPGYDPFYAEFARYAPNLSTVRLPILPTPRVESYLESVLVPKLRPEHDFLVIGLASGDEYAAWLRGRLSPDGFRARRLGIYGGIGVTVFEKN